MAIPVTPTPTPGNYYRARHTDTLLGITGRAYGLRSGSRRLRMCKMLNAHPFNWRLHRDGRNSFERRHLPRIIQLARKFPKDEAAYSADSWEPLAKGTSRPLIYVPPADDIWYLPPPEVVQSTLRMCWAAALTSLSQARDLKLRFTDQNKLRIAMAKNKIPGRRRPISIVSPTNGGLRFMPVRSVEADPPFPTLVRGELSMLAIAFDFGLDAYSYFGDGTPDTIQAARDNKLTMDDLQTHLLVAGGPIAKFSLKDTRRRNIGHATVVFGASATDDIYIEMDPFTGNVTETGPVYGSEDTITLRRGSVLGGTPGHAMREIFILE